MSETVKQNVTRRSIWHRLVFMIVLGVAFSVAEAVIFAVVAFQFLSSLFTDQTNDRLSRLGRNLARYLQQIVVFMTFASEEKPFPFAPWPDEPDKPEEEPREGPAGDRRTEERETEGEATEYDQAQEARTDEVAEGNDIAGNAEKPRR